VVAEVLIIIQEKLEQVFQVVQVVVECQEQVLVLYKQEELEMIRQPLQHKVLREDHINTHHLIDKVVEEVVQYVLEALELLLPLKQEEMEQDYQQGLVLMENLVEVIDITLVAVQEVQDL
jgi:transcriptional regulator with GAF, ATPase, and Fis domain